MNWELIVTLAVAIPIILFPVAFVWYINISGLVHALKEARSKKTVTATATATK